MPSKSNRPLAVVDTSVFIAMLKAEEIENRAERSANLLDRDDIKLAVPAIVLVELYGSEFVRRPEIPEKRADERLESVRKEQEKIRSLGLAVLELNALGAEKAAELIGRTNMKWPDASIAGAALAAGAERIYTWDRGMIDRVNALYPELALEPEYTGTLEEASLTDS